MSEILFGGKRADNGEWVEGFPFVRRNTKGEVIDCFIIQEAYEQVTNGQRYVRSNLKSECFRVIPKTIRQFTGLTDKNGKKIFEGDIIKTQPFRDKPHSLHSKTKQHIGVIKYRADKQGAEWYVDIDNCGKYTYCTYSEFFGCEVIGNLHDNPELLKGGAE